MDKRKQLTYLNERTKQHLGVLFFVAQKQRDGGACAGLLTLIDAAHAGFMLQCSKYT